MKLFKNKLIKRLSITKGIGAIFGILAFIMLPMLYTELSMMLRIVFLLWYITLGGLMGLFGVMNYHPLLKISLPWYFRGAFLGGWMAFILVLFIYDDLTTVTIGTPYESLSPFLFIFEGIFFGLIADYFGTKFGGEGKGLLD